MGVSAFEERSIDGILSESFLQFGDQRRSIKHFDFDRYLLFAFFRCKYLLSSQISIEFRISIFNSEGVICNCLTIFDQSIFNSEMIKIILWHGSCGETESIFTQKQFSRKHLIPIRLGTMPFLNQPMSSRSRFQQLVLTYGLLSAIAAVMLIPLLWLVSTSLKSPTENIFQFPPQLLPTQPTLENFITVWQTNPFGQYLFNSTLVSVLTVGLNLLFCSLAAYPLARLKFQGREIIFSAIVATILIPFQIVMIPLYVLAVQLGLRNTYLGVIFPGIASAFGIFLLRQAFQGVPKELEEAARMDGCSELGLWWHVMIPSIRPALVTLAIFVFIGSWSDFLWPLLVLDRPELFTLPLGVANLAGTFTLDWRLIAAGSVISIVPILLFFLAMQHYIVPTESGSGVKG